MCHDFTGFLGLMVLLVSWISWFLTFCEFMVSYTWNLHVVWTVKPDQTMKSNPIHAFTAVSSTTN